MQDDDVPLLEEPIVATVHEKPVLSFTIENANRSSQEQQHADPIGTEQAIRQLTQFAIASPEDDSADPSELAEHIPESLNALFNAIVMLKSHTALAKQEAAQAVQDTDMANRQAAVWKQRAVLLSKAHETLQCQTAALQAEQERVSHERKILKRAYKQLALDSAVNVSRYVEHAIALHEEHLVQQQQQSHTPVTDRKHLLDSSVSTSSTATSNTTTPQEEEEDSLESSDPYKPLQLRVNSASLQKQLLMKPKRGPKLQSEDLMPESPRAVRNLTIPSIIYQPH